MGSLRELSQQPPLIQLVDFLPDGSRSRSPMPMADELRLPITGERDIVVARSEGRALARTLGYSKTDGTLVATAISEIARNIIVHAGSGEMVLKSCLENGRTGIEIVAFDSGPGIQDISEALHAGSGSKGGLGLGLPGARRLMDEFDVRSATGKGTTVTMRKWRIRDELEQTREERSRG